MKIRPINLKEAKIIKAKLIKNIESNLKKGKMEQEELKKGNAPKEAIEKLQKRIDEIEKDLKECKKDLINKNDF